MSNNRDFPKIVFNPRTEIINNADLEILKTNFEIREKYNLTDLEYIHILTNQIQEILKIHLKKKYKKILKLKPNQKSGVICKS